VNAPVKRRAGKILLFLLGLGLLFAFVSFCMGIGAMAIQSEILRSHAKSLRDLRTELQTPSSSEASQRNPRLLDEAAQRLQWRADSLDASSHSLNLGLYILCCSTVSFAMLVFMLGRFTGRPLKEL
jgi:hypothetical protein